MIKFLNVYFPIRLFLLCVSELALIALVFLLATFVRFGGDARVALTYEGGVVRIAVVTGIFMLCMYYFDLYDTLVVSNRREVPARLLQVLGIGTVILAVIYYLYPEVRLARGIFLPGVLLVALLLPPWRRLYFRLIRSLRSANHAVIVGASSLAAALSHELRNRPVSGIDLVGYLDTSSNGAAMNGLPYLGGPEVVSELVRREGVSRVIVAMEDRRGNLPVEQLLGLKAKGTLIHDGAEIYEIITGKIPLDTLRPSWLVFSPAFRRSRLQKVCKRAISVIGSILALILTAPVMAVIAIAIKLDSDGPVIFRQQRVGEDGKIFTIYKFRTMLDSADAGVQSTPASEDDARFTFLGRWLRRTRLDELPQLCNILKGEMDFVGPRPFLPNMEQELARTIPFYSQRWSVKPGATGWAQVNRGYCATVKENAEKLSYDLFYIKNASLGLDLLILVQTVKILLWGRGSR